MKFSDFGKPLNKKISIYVPSTMHVNEKIDNTKYVNETEEFFSKIFGGCTSYNATGNYISSDKKLIKESVTIVYANTDNLTFNCFETDIIKYACYLRKKMKQECISVEIDNNLYFI